MTNEEGSPKTQLSKGREIAYLLACCCCGFQPYLRIQSKVGQETGLIFFFFLKKNIVKLKKKQQQCLPKQYKSIKVLATTKTNYTESVS